MSEDASAHQRRLDRQFDAIREIEEVVAPRERHRLGIEGVGVGGVFRAEGRPFRVTAKSEYREGAERWYELEIFDLFGGETVTLEWERDDEVEVCLNDREISLDRLGSSFASIEAMADRESGELRIGGTTYRYDDDYECTFHRDGQGAGEPVFIVEFEDAEGERTLAVEAWGKDDREIQVWLGHYLEPEAIEVLVQGNG